MRHNDHRLWVAAVLAAAFAIALPLSGQYREYYFHGKVVNTDKLPLAGVEINLRDVATSRGYDVKTDKDGEYRFAGLPHGAYKVTFHKEGYAPKEDEWKFEAPQVSMKKIEIPDLTLVPQELVAKAEQMKAMEAEIKAAVDKIKAKDYDGAAAQLKAYLDKNPDDSNALFYLGLSYARKMMFAEAVAPLTRVTEMVPNYAPAYFELAGCYSKLDDKTKALEMYQKTIELDPSNVDSAYNAGLILFGLSRIGEAKAVFEKALGLRPNDPEILDMASRCYINAGEFAKAIDCLEKAKAGYTDPEKLKFLDDLIAKLKEQIKK